MAITYTPVDIRGKAVEPILEQVFFANKTIANEYVTFNTDIKAGTIFTEAGMTVSAQVYTGLALASAGSINITDRYITPVKLEYKQTYLNEALRHSRFNTTMKGGAWEIESDEFNSTVLAMTGPAVSQDAETQFWSGVTTAGKAFIAGLTPGAPQGSISASAQTAIAALTAGPVDGVISKVLFDGAIGAYIKVPGIAITTANIVAEYVKIFNAIPAENLLDELSPVLIYAPRAHRSLILAVNAVQGNALQTNFVVEGSGASARFYFLGVEVVFVPLPNAFVYAQKKNAISWNTDFLDDVSRFETGKVANDGDLMFVRTIYTLAANVGQASKGVLYGG